MNDLKPNDTQQNKEFERDLVLPRLAILTIIGSFTAYKYHPDPFRGIPLFTGCGTLTIAITVLINYILETKNVRQGGLSLAISFIVALIIALSITWLIMD